LELPHGLVGRLEETVKGLAGLRHALLGEAAHLVGDCKLLEGVLGHGVLRKRAGGLILP
jgi:hypothetical protein